MHGKIIIPYWAIEAYVLRKSYLPDVISWVDKKHWSLYVFDNLSREETLPLQFITDNMGSVLETWLGSRMKSTSQIW
jgi:hypothetical protein